MGCRATSWAEVEALTTAARVLFVADFKAWSTDCFAPDLAQYWPERRLVALRSRYGGTPRRASGWPECWFEHALARNVLLSVYVWDQAICGAKDAEAARALYWEHVRNVVVPVIQEVADMCSLGHADPTQPPAAPEPWKPSPPPLPGRPALTIVPDPVGAPTVPGTQPLTVPKPVPVHLRPRLTLPCRSSGFAGTGATRDLSG